MIKYHITNNELSVKGHALYSKYGTDIVCSSVSTLLITNINLIELLGFIDDIKFRISEGMFYLKIIRSNNILEKIFLNIANTLNELKLLYPKNIMED